MMVRMCAQPAVTLGSRSTKKYNFKSTCPLPLSSDRAVERRKLSKFTAICQKWMLRWVYWQEYTELGNKTTSHCLLSGLDSCHTLLKGDSRSTYSKERGASYPVHCNISFKVKQESNLGLNWQAVVQQRWCQPQRGWPPPVSAPPAAAVAHPSGTTAPARQCGRSTPADGLSAARRLGVSVCDSKQGLWGPLRCAIPPPCRDVHINMVWWGFVLFQGGWIYVCINQSVNQSFYLRI